MMTLKQAILAAFLAGVLAVAAEAQQSGKAVAVDGGGPPPSTNYVWITINGTPTNQNSVMIRHTDGTAQLDAGGVNPVRLTDGTLTYGFNQPYDIVGSTLHHRVFVSNQGAGTVSVVDSDTLLPLGVIALPNGTTARGLSLSEDESAVFVAGGHTTGPIDGPAVWQIDTVSLSPGAAPIAALNDSTHVAEDCVVIRSGNAGGSGNGPGKVYFSVRASGTLTVLPGYIGVIPLNPPAAQTTIPTEAGPLASVGTPITMERTADHRFVFVSCSKLVGFASDVRIIRIDPLTDAATAPTVLAAANDTPTNRIVDVSWTVGTGGVNRGVVMEFNQVALSIVEIDETGAATTAPIPANQGGLTSPQTVRFTPGSQQLYVGDDIGTQNGYSFYDATAALSFKGSPIGVGSRCLNFAVLPTPAVVISDITARAGFAGGTGPSQVTVHGAGFQLGATYKVGATTTTAGFVDSNTLLVDLSGGAAASVGLTVTNVNFQSASIAPFYRRYTPELRPGFTVMLPSASQGYRMLSLPQYSSLSALKAGFDAQLGPYNPVLYRVFFYRGGRYVELNALPDDGCDLAGESFWVLTRNGAMLTLSEPDVRQNDAGADRVIPLNTGFNMVSLPQTNAAGSTGQIPWASVRVTTDPADFSVAGTFQTTSANGLLIVDPAVEYVNGGYFLATNLFAGQGVWVRNISGKPAYLVFQPGAVTKPTGPSFSSGIPPAAGSMPPGPPSGISEPRSRRSGCGFLGPEGLLLVLLLKSRRRR